MIKAVVFDCFGVLATEGWRSFKAKYFGHDPALFERVSQISWQADRGLISSDEAVRTTAKLAGITPAEFRQAVNRNVPDEALFAYLKQLKPHYKLGLLSNVARDYLKEIFSPVQLDLFDAIALSYQHGFIKPERQAFEIIAKQLGVDVSECVFIDDDQRNVDGARRAGMSAVLYQDAAQLQDELRSLLSTDAKR